MKFRLPIYGDRLSSVRERLIHRQQWRRNLRARKGADMRKYIIEFDDRDTMPERLEAMAKEHGITPEYLIHRAIGEHLGGYGLSDLPPDFKAKNLDEFFVAAGAMKPK